MRISPRAKVHVLHPQARAFHQAQPRAIEQARDKPVHPSQHLAIEKENRRLGLVLGGGRDLAHYREVRQKRLDLGCTHFAWMPLAVEENEASNPGHVLLFGAIAVVLDPETLPDLVEQAGAGVGADFE